MAAKRKLKPIPQFKSEDEEREFWDTHDSVDYIDWSRARPAVFPNLKPSTETISLRLPASLLAELKSMANERDVPYQSLLKIFLAERIVIERGRASVAMERSRARYSVPETKPKRPIIRKTAPRRSSR